MIPDYVRLEPGLIVSGPDGRTYYIVRRPLTFTVDWWGLRLVNSSNIYSFDNVCSATYLRYNYSVAPSVLLANSHEFEEEGDDI